MIDLRICGFDWKIDGTFKGSFENAGGTRCLFLINFICIFNFCIIFSSLSFSSSLFSFSLSQQDVFAYSDFSFSTNG
jgi:hypothetical protein